MTGTQEGRFASLLEDMQTWILTRRIRIKDSFRDYDPLHCGRCTAVQLERVLYQLHTKLTPEDVHMFVDRFTDRALVTTTPQHIDYKMFCAKLDPSCVIEGKFYSPRGAPVVLAALRLPCNEPFQPNKTLNEKRVMEVLNQVASYTRTQGFELNQIMWPRHRLPGLAIHYPWGSGKVTEDGFKQRFPFGSKFSKQDIQLLVQRYMDKDGAVHAREFVKDVDACLQALDKAKLDQLLTSFRYDRAPVSARGPLKQTGLMVANSS